MSVLWNYTISKYFADIDECLQRVDGCDYFSTNCSNFYGSFDCVCLAGFEKDNKTHCKGSVL